MVIDSESAEVISENVGKTLVKSDNLVAADVTVGIIN